MQIVRPGALKCFPADRSGYSGCKPLVRLNRICPGNSQQRRKRRPYFSPAELNQAAFWRKHIGSLKSLECAAHQLVPKLIMRTRMRNHLQETLDNRTRLLIPFRSTQMMQELDSLKIERRQNEGSVTEDGKEFASWPSIG